MKTLFTFCTAFFLLGTLSAQDISLGFKTGLNYSNILMESEKDINTGKDLETTDFTSGFQIGIMVGYPMTDEFGVRGEFLFSQKGAKYKYRGLGTRSYDLSTETKTATGFMQETYGINNGYLEIPLMAYYKIGKKLEVSGGLGFGFLVSSKATGERSFEGTTKLGNNVPLYTRTITYNYFTDGKEQNSATTEVVIDGESLILPIDEIKDLTFEGNLYNRFEMNAFVGLSYYFNNSLFVNVRGAYGLTDVTNDDVQIIKQIDQNTEYPDGLLKKSNDRNVNISATIGFSF